MARTVTLPGLTPDQISNAETIYSVGQSLGASPRDIAIAIMTAMDESGLHNDPGGDRDSAGLFQQRPSQGWGTYQQVTDPTYAATQFYDHLLSVGNRDQLTPWMAAQTVQVSGYPDGSNYEAYWNGPANGFQVSAPQLFEALSSGAKIKGGGPVTGGKPDPHPPIDPKSLSGHLTDAQRKTVLRYLQTHGASQTAIIDFCTNGGGESIPGIWATIQLGAYDSELITMYTDTVAGARFGHDTPYTKTPGWLAWPAELGKIFAWLMNGSNWRRIGLFLLGAIILFFAADRMLK